MRFTIISLFPSYFDGPFGVSLLKRARDNHRIDIRLVDLRTFGQGPYEQVDDRVYGGGPGMVLMAQPVIDAVRHVQEPRSKVVYLSPQGKRLTAKKCEELAQKRDPLILICGHYEGLDERALELVVDEEISIGDYVLTSGAPAAAVVVDAVSRFVPGVVGNSESPQNDSFADGIFDAPLYTRPAEVEGLCVPEVLRCGHHAEIAAWRDQQAREKTQRVRPDLIENSEGNSQDPSREKEI